MGDPKLPRQHRRLIDGLITLLVLLSIYAAYLWSGNNITFDSVWTVHTSMSLLREGNADLDEYRSLLETAGQSHAYALETSDGRLYNAYPIGSAIVALPLLAVIDRVAPLLYGIDLQQYLLHAIPEPIELLIAALLVALTAVVLYRVARLYVPILPALLLTAIFAFCTSAWSTASRALWQHTASMLMLSTALYLALLARRRPALVQFISVPLALAYTIRPTNSVAVIVFTVFVFSAYRRYLTRYLSWALLIAVPFVLFNLSVYHTLLSPYYRQFQEFSAGTVLPALIGQWLSPSRGLLVYSPVIGLAFGGIWIKIRGKSFDRLDACLLIVIALHWLAISIWPMWWGGWSYGPRMMSDVLPFLFYFMIPVFVAAPQWKRWQQAACAAVAVLLIAWSFAAHYRGASDPATLDWNRKPVYVDEYPDRLWDWIDPQLARGIKWGQPIDLALSGVPILYFDSATYPLLGGNQLRLRKFDVSSAVIAPVQPGWLALADEQIIPPALAPLFADVTARGRFQTITDRVPYSLYYLDLGRRLSAAAARARQVVFNPTTKEPAALPVPFDHVAQLIGHEASVSATDEITIVTYWRVLQTAESPVKLVVRAVGQDGRSAAEEERLDVAARTWLPGDLIAQVNRLTVPREARPVWIEASLINPDSGERLGEPVLLDQIGSRP